MKNTEIFEDLARHYAQQNPPQENGGQNNPQDEGGNDPEQINPAVDTDSLQQGQVIYDLSGKEFTVLEPTPDGKKNIMPTDQVGQQVPQGIKQVGDDDLGASYTTSPQASRKANFDNPISSAEWNIKSAIKDLQPLANKESSELGGNFSSAYIEPLEEMAGFLGLEQMVSEHVSKKAQDNLSINWNDFTDILSEMHQAIDKQDAKHLLEAAEDMVDLILVNINMPEGAEVSQVVPQEKIAEVLPAFRVAQMGDLQSFHEPVTFTKETDNENGLMIGEDGFGACMARLKELLKGGYEVVDVLLTLGEEFPRELANKVLQEARSTGIL